MKWKALLFATVLIVLCFAKAASVEMSGWEISIFLAVSIGLFGVCARGIQKDEIEQARIEAGKLTKAQLDDLWNALRSLQTEASELLKERSTLQKLTDETKKMLSEQKLAANLKPHQKMR